jgi:hypothetical protein
VKPQNDFSASSSDFAAASNSSNIGKTKLDIPSATICVKEVTTVSSFIAIILK